MKRRRGEGEDGERRRGEGEGAGLIWFSIGVVYRGHTKGVPSKEQLLLGIL